MPDPAITEYRNDGAAMNALAMLSNRMTGLGQQGRDKYLEHTIALDFTPLTRPDLQALYRKSKICEKVVDLLPKAATAENWLEVTVGKGRKGIPAKAVQYSEDLKLRSAIREAAIMGRLDGDGFAIVGVDDGGEPWEPVNEGRIRQISWVYPVDRWRIHPETTTGRPGNPEWYSLYLPFTDALPNQQVSGKIHRSRVLRFPGKKLWGDMITHNTGYNDSVLQTFFASFVKYLIAIEYSTRMVQDYNVFTYKLQGLAQLILQGDEEKIFHRFQAILMSMSSLGGLAMDADKEDAQFISRNFSGLDTLIDRLKDDTSAAAAMPPTKLWGSSQKTALSNSSEGDKYEWADCVADYRSEILAEPTSDFFRLVFLAQNGPTGGRLPDSWGIKYRSALRLNPKEQTELRALQTEKVDVPSIDKGVLLKEEVRDSAWSGDEYTIERQLQPELWAKQQAEAEEAEAPEAEEAEEADGGPDAPVEPGLEPRTDDATPAKRIIDWHGLKLGLQYQPFDIRHGKVLPVAYGHIQKTRGADGMACDCYVGADLESDRVFEVTQLVNGQFDEHKYMLGFDSLDVARETFLKVMPAAMFGGIREVGLAGLEAYRTDGGSEGTNPKAPSGGTSRIDGDRLDECDEWREDAGTPCGRSWIKAGAKCTKGVSSSHPSANPNHPGHVAYQGALAAASGSHTHPASNPTHPDHTAYKAAHSQHGGKTPLPSGGGGSDKGKEGAYQEHPSFSTYAEKPELLPGESLSQRRERWQAAKDAAAEALVAKGKAQTLDTSHPDTKEGWKNVQASNSDREQLMAALAASNPLRHDWLLTQLRDVKSLARDNVTPEDVLAIKLYTSNDFGSMNGALRGLDGDSYRKTINPNQSQGRSTESIKDEALQGSKVVATALNKLPDHTGEVYRGFDLRDGLTLDDVEQMYKPGSSIVEKAFTSTSTSKPDPGTAFGSKPVQFVMQSKSGKSVRDFSESQSEEEVLFRPYTAFKVQKVKRDGDRLVVHLEES